MMEPLRTQFEPKRIIDTQLGKAIRFVRQYDIRIDTMPAPQFNIENVFRYHAPFGTQPVRYVNLREKARELAYLIVESTPPSAEQTLALRDLQRCIMMANAAIAINEQPEAIHEQPEK